MPSRLITNKALSSNVATLTTSTPHGVSAGTYITVVNVDSTFNGSYTVLGTPQNNTLTYAKVSASVASTAVPGSASANILVKTIHGLEHNFFKHQQLFKIKLKQPQQALADLYQ